MGRPPLPLGTSGKVLFATLPNGRVKARVDGTKAREAEAQAQYSQTVLLALQEVENSLVRYRTAHASVERIREAV